MASKVFVINNSPVGDSNIDKKWQSDLLPILEHKHPSKLWLFMIGGSAAGIITPLSRFFMSMVSTDVIVPIFIDNQCHSDNTSSAILDIARYEEFCRLTCIKSKISPPFLFIENSIQSLKVLRRFQSIVYQSSR